MEGETYSTEMLENISENLDGLSKKLKDEIDSIVEERDALVEAVESLVEDRDSLFKKLELMTINKEELDKENTLLHEKVDALEGQLNEMDRVHNILERDMSIEKIELSILKEYDVKYLSHAVLGPIIKQSAYNSAKTIKEMMSK